MDSFEKQLYIEYLKALTQAISGIPMCLKLLMLPPVQMETLNARSCSSILI